MVAMETGGYNNTRVPPVVIHVHVDNTASNQSGSLLGVDYEGIIQVIQFLRHHQHYTFYLYITGDGMI